MEANSLFQMYQPANQPLGGNCVRSKVTSKAIGTTFVQKLLLLVLSVLLSGYGRAEAATTKIFALTTNNNLLAIDSATPGTIISSVAISGLQSGETIVGIDFRPSSGQLYAIGNSSRVFTIDLSSGAATAIGNAPFTPPLSGTDFGVDFNPVPDLIRVVSDGDQNLRLSPATGAVAGMDTPLAYDAGDINKDANRISSQRLTPITSLVPLQQLFMILIQISTFWLRKAD